MLEIKSISAAAYITFKTDVVADVKIDNRGFNYFKFPNDKEILDSYNRYREAVRGKGEIPVELARFNGIIRDYKKESKRTSGPR